MAATGDKVKSRKSFEFRMSKKVAELTQVVHMLFTKNHEREVEVQTLTELYNAELDRLHAKYKAKIDKLKKSRDDKNSELFQEEVKQAVAENDRTWSEKCEVLEAQILVEKTGQNMLQESIAKIQAEMVTLKQSSNDTMFSLRAQLRDKQGHIDKLAEKEQKLEKRLNEEKRAFDLRIEEVQKSLDLQHTDNEQLRRTLAESQLNEEQLIKKLEKLEGEAVTLRRALNKTSSELSDVRNRPHSEKVLPNHWSTPQAPKRIYQQQQQSSQEVTEELENLRRLVQKYRLELSNREGNFNRMFTEKTPVLVDQQSAFGTLMTKSKPKDRSLSCDFSSSSFSESDKFSKVGLSRVDSNLTGGNKRLTSLRRSTTNRTVLAQHTAHHM